VQPSGSQKGGSKRVLNQDCREDEGEKIQGADSCRQSHGQHLVGHRRNLVSGILDKRSHNQFRAICADIKEVKTMNSKAPTKQDD
jgi:hypothetical protein